MEPRDLMGILFIIIIIITCGVYASRQNAPNTVKFKQLSKDSGSEATDSEPEAKGKAVDEMDLIQEEKEMRSNDDIKSDELSDDDSEEYSMQRMVEEYQKSRTLAKKVSEIIEDISDTFKRKSIEIKKKFEAPKPPAVVVPMSIKEKMEKLNAQKLNHKNKKKKKKKEKNKSIIDEKESETETDKNQSNNCNYVAIEIMDIVKNEEKKIQNEIQIGIEEEKVMEIQESVNAVNAEAVPHTPQNT